MALPSRPQTFALENCRNLLDKLGREIERLRAAASDDFATHNDCAFNAAVTAWHLCDWVFRDMTPQQRADLKINSLGALQDEARKCRALYLCQYVATASKHWYVRDYPDPKVKVLTTANSIFPVKAEVTSTSEPQSPKIRLYVGIGCYLYFDDDGEVKEAEAVFDAAHEFWTQFIYQNGIAADDTRSDLRDWPNQ